MTLRPLTVSSFVRSTTVGFTLLLLALPWGCKSSELGSDVVAKVNGHRVLRSEVEKYYRNQTSGSPQKPAPEQTASLRLSILKQLVEDEIMMQRAEKLGLLATDEELEAKFAEFKAPYTQEEFDKRLTEKNLTVDDFKRDLRKSITTEKVINKEITSKITISDADITNYYSEQKAEFNLIEPQYHLAQIVITTQPSPQVNNLKNDKAQNEAEARKKVQMILNRLDSGEDFATLAMNYSEQPNTSGSGGDMGLIPESNLKQDREAYDAITKLKAGQSTGILTLNDPPNSRHSVGFSIIKLISKEPAGQRGLTDPRVQQYIRQTLRDRREQLLRAAYYEVVHNQAKIENYFAEEMLKNAGQK